MDLKSLQNLSTDDKLLILQTTGGLAILEELAKSNTLYQIARLLKISLRTLTKWRRCTPDIAAILGDPKPKDPMSLEPDLSKPLAYRILCSYEDHKTYLKGSIYREYVTQQELCDDFMQEYFGAFGVFELNYRTQYLKAIANTGLFKLNNYTCIAFCTVNKRGKILIHKPSK